MKITSVKKYKGTTYEVVIDEERKIYLHADIIADYSVFAGTELDTAALRKIIWASNFRRAYQRALFLLDYRDYPYAEMYNKLLGTYKSERLCGEVMKKLTSNGFIDDRRYAERAARKLVEVKHFGYRRALREITQKGIDRFTAEDALEPYREAFDENLMHLLESRHARFLTDASDRRSIEKVKNSLVRYGYDFTQINRAVKEYFENNYEEDN